MKRRSKHWLAGLTGLALASPAFAADPTGEAQPSIPLSPTDALAARNAQKGTSPAFSEPTKVYVGGTNPKLNPQELAGVAMTEGWEQRSYAAMEPQQGKNGAIVFRYGESLPTVVCAALHVTDVELQPGEVVAEKGLQWGDTVRWIIDASLSNPGLTGVEHIIVKPLEIGITTSLVIVTDRRTYNLELISTEAQYFHRVAFSYHDQPPAPVQPASAPGKAQDGVPSARVALESPGRSTGGADGKTVAYKPEAERIEYRISGDAPWKPLAAYAKGEKTFLRMPAHVREAPALFELEKSGWFGLGSAKNLVNYRVSGRTYVVDTVLDRAVLVVGVGSSQQKITLTRKD